jgi:hypothetical protein
MLVRFQRGALAVLFSSALACGATGREGTTPPGPRAESSSVAPITPARESPPESPPAEPKMAPGELEQRRFPGAMWPPPGYVEKHEPCQLETVTNVARRGAVYLLTARVKNVTKSKLDVSVPDRCPQGPAAFQGLRAGYDYYAACTKGACAGPREPRRFTLAPGESMEIAAVEIEPARSQCDGALEPGSYTMSFSFETPLKLCTGQLPVLEVPSPKPAVRKPSGPCPPQPACGIACPGGAFAVDENGCTQCACAERTPSIGPQVPRGF